MAQRAPASPSTETLKRRHPLHADAHDMIAERRARLSDAINGVTVSFVAIVGGCALTKDVAVSDPEARRLDYVMRTEPGLVALQRNNFWKPRTNPRANHGLETERSTVEDAFRIVTHRANTTANAIAEIGHGYHIDRYGHLLTAAWIGGRNVTNSELVEEVAKRLPELPLGIKNGLDGDVSIAMKQVNFVNHLRGAHGAPAVLIYRGGDNARDPKSWEKHYREVLDQTNGLTIADLAHGGEMAHAPRGDFTKTAAGQIACMNAVIRIAERYGEMPLGTMMEATDSRDNPVDPPMPFDIAMNGVLRLNELNNELAGVSTEIA